jgi:hypothetical protein
MMGAALDLPKGPQHDDELGSDAWGKPRLGGWRIWTIGTLQGRRTMAC